MLLLLAMSLARADDTFVFDLNNVRGGDDDAAQATKVLRSQEPALNACLQGVAKGFAEQAFVSELHVEVDAGGAVSAVDFFGIDTERHRECLEQALKRVKFPAAAAGSYTVKPFRVASPVPAVETKQDGAHTTLTAVFRDGNVSIDVVARFDAEVGVGERALFIPAEVSQGDEVLVTGTHEPVGAVRCVPAGERFTLSARPPADLRPARGEQARYEVLLRVSPCGASGDTTRLPVGAVRLIDGAVTVWVPSDLADQPW
jgi:hypothetical protein